MLRAGETWPRYVEETCLSKGQLAAKTWSCFPLLIRTSCSYSILASSPAWSQGPEQIQEEEGTGHSEGAGERLGRARESRDWGHENIEEGEIFPPENMFSHMMYLFFFSLCIQVNDLKNYKMHSNGYNHSTSIAVCKANMKTLLPCGTPHPRRTSLK